MIILGIESSCDETALALVRDGRLLAAVMSSQADIHALFGGVVPELASREHARLIGPLLDELLRQANLDIHEVDRVAFARGPGLLGSLLVGAAFAKALALGLGKPLIGVNHLQAHLLAPGLEMELRFPALGLLVSGGHTHIYRMESAAKFKLLGRTLDDAAGEAFDKVGKMLGLPYPAGRLIDEYAHRGVIQKDLFRCPYLGNDNLDFSFSGLKTAAALLIEVNPELKTRSIANPAPALYDFCASLTATIARTLLVKFKRALQREEGIASLVLAGGVASNSFIRAAMREVAEEEKLPLILPSPALCTDNGAMIAYTGYLLAQTGHTHDLSVSSIPRGTPVPEDYLS